MAAVGFTDEELERAEELIASVRDRSPLAIVDDLPGTRHAVPVVPYFTANPPDFSKHKRVRVERGL